MWMDGQRYAPAVLPTEKRTVTHLEVGWVPGNIWTNAENLPPKPGLQPRAVQYIASHYTD
jgi:hypothetical protein